MDDFMDLSPGLLVLRPKLSGGGLKLGRNGRDVMGSLVQWKAENPSERGRGTGVDCLHPASFRTVGTVQA